MTRTILITGAAAIWAFAFVGFFGTYVTTFDPALRLVAAMLYGVPVVFGAIVALALRPHALDIPVLALLAMYALVCALSVDLTASLETLGLATAYGSLFLVLLRVGPGPLRQGLVTGCAAAASAWLAFSAVGWLQGAMAWVALDGSIPPLTARSGSLWLSTDAVAALALLAAPLYLHIKRASTRNVLAAVAVVSAVIVIPLSGGRVEWVAILVAAAVYLLTSGRYDWRRIWRPTVIVLGAVALVTTGLFMTGRLGTLSGRTFIWQTAMAVIAQHPLDGAGPGTFSWVRLAESPELLNRYPVYHAHNLVLQVLADGGLLLLAAIAALSLVYVRHIVAGGTPLTRAQRAGIGSLAGFAVILMMDELTQLPALTALGIGTAAFVARDRSIRWPSARTPLLRAIPAIGCLLLVVVALPAVLGAHQARAAATDGRERALAGDWRGAQGAYAVAAAAWPTRASYELALGLAEAQLGRDDSARAHYERAHALSPGDPRALGALGILGTTHAERADVLGRASRLGAMDSQYGYRLALELVAAGDRLLATEELGRAGLIDPQLLVASDLVRLGLEMDAVAEAVRGALADEGPRAGADRRATEDAIDVALARDAVDDGTFAALGLAGSGQLPAARAMVAEILRVDPQDRAARIAARELSRLACDFEEEARHDRLLALLPGGYASLYFAAPGVRESRDHIYREMGLGDYQPPDAPPLPVYVYEWPVGYLPPAPCAGQP